MQIQKNVSLTPYTSFEVGGNAEYFALVHNHAEFIEALKCTLPDMPLWLIGYGSNSLISDKGLDGMTICVRDGEIEVVGSQINADAGVWWDDVVLAAIRNNLWGIELMSEIPGSVGGSVFINITAYGQSLGPKLDWIEVWDRNTSEVKKINGKDLVWGYKSSDFQDHPEWVILKAAINLSTEKTDELVYQKALDVAEELDLDINDLAQRREIIIEARKRAGSLWKPESKHEKTAGSFFRNPVVAGNIAEKIISYDETGKTAEQIKKMNQVHGGDQKRVSAAHVLLAAGFNRGQTWGKVKLNDKNLLKIETLTGATATDVYRVAKEIQETCYEKLGVKLQPEVQILGDF